MTPTILELIAAVNEFVLDTSNTERHTEWTDIFDDLIDRIHKESAP